MLKVEYRRFACDQCGTINMQQTNHEGQIYNVKCRNWPCTPGFTSFTSMTFWSGEIKLRKMSFVDKDHNPVFMHKALGWRKKKGASK